MAVPDALRGRRVPAPLAASLGVLVAARTYLNLLYLLLAFPLGIAYFTVLVTVGSFALGLGPLGVVVAPLLLPVVHGLALAERALTVRLLGVDVPSDERPVAWLRAAVEEPPSADALWQRTKTLALARHTWTRLAYLLAKFPFGIAAFVLLTVLGSLSVAFLAAPLLYDVPGAGTTYQVVRPVVAVVVPVVERAGVSVGGTPTLAVSATPHEVETLPGALVTAFGGAVLGVGSLHVCNAVARAWGWVAAVTLRSERSA